MRNAVGAVQSLLVLGGTSEIALATCRRLIAGGAHTVVLAARDGESAEQAAEELRGLGARVEVLSFDAEAGPEPHHRLAEEAFSKGTDIDLVLVAFGTLGDQAAAEREAAEAVRVVETNFTGAVSSLVAIASRLHDQGHGTIVVLSSIAAVRARRSNFVYGSSKAGLDAFAQGLGDALAPSGIQVMVVRPGFVHTKMTAGMPPAPLSVRADDVAQAIADGLRRGAATVWVPPQLRWLALILRLMPRALLRRIER